MKDAASIYICIDIVFRAASYLSVKWRDPNYARHTAVLYIINGYWFIAGSIEPGFSIVKQPWSRVVSEGSSFKLTCRAELKEVCESALSYQWFHNDTAIRGASACIFKKQVS